jgi:Family of unknown function (DUF6356)
MLDRWFFAHPRSIDESYLEHQACALKFSGSLIMAGLACFVHALVPGLFERTGSTMVKRLHQEMVTKRVRPTQSDASEASSYGAFDVGI